MSKKCKDGRVPPCALPGAYSVTNPTCVDGSRWSPTVAAYVTLEAALEAEREKNQKLKREIDDWRSAHRQRNFERGCGG